MKLQLTPGIYCIYNIANDWAYIGASKTIEPRMYRHLYHLNLMNHVNTQLQLDWNHYGADQFDWRILEITNDFTKESYYANQHGVKVYSEFHRKPIAILPKPVNQKGIRIQFDYEGQTLTFNSRVEMSLAMGRSRYYIQETLKRHPHLTYADFWRYLCKQK